MSQSTPRRNGPRPTLATPSSSILFQAPIISPLSFPPLPKLLIETCSSSYKQLYFDDEENLNFTINKTKLIKNQFNKLLNETLIEFNEDKIRIEEEKNELDKNVVKLENGLLEEKLILEEVINRREESARERKIVMEKIVEVELEIKEIHHQLIIQTNKKQKRATQLQSQSNKNQSELNFFEEKLGLKMKGKGRDKVQFKFANLDSSNFSKTYSFDIDVSEYEYKLVPTKLPTPPIIIPSTIIDSLLKDLNESRNFCNFILEMRLAFKDEISKVR